MTSDDRLIEHAFPLKQASLDSVHEKNVRHGHISTLHIWPARRPLAACRAALIATLLPDPGTPEARKKLVERIGGTVVKKIEKKKVGGKTIEVEREETVGGVLHWGRESVPAMEEFRQEIRKAYGGRAPRVLDPFAGGGAIPLEAMRLGCEATAIDINPVAWFILKCTLEYPQKLAGQHRPLPQFALESPEFMETFFKGTGKLTKRQLERNLQAVQSRLFPAPDVDLAWHVRAWGWWVLQNAKANLEKFYPTIDGKPTIAYLWARTVTCKNCRATIPLLKTRWLCKKDGKRVLLLMRPNADKSAVELTVESKVPIEGANAAQRREADRRLGKGTMSAAGVSCPCCGRPDSVAMTLDDIQLESQQGRTSATLTCVVVEGLEAKEYCVPSAAERNVLSEAGTALDEILAAIPYGRPVESIDPARPSPNARGLSGLTRYGLSTFDRLFNDRQLLALASLVAAVRRLPAEVKKCGYEGIFAQALADYLTLAVDRVADRNSTICHWDVGRETISNTFQRYALRINWDYCEVNPLSNATGGFVGAVEWIGLVASHTTAAVRGMPTPDIGMGSATEDGRGPFDLILTDPPYFDAIPYSDLSDFFYVWLRRTLGDRYPHEFGPPLTLKDGELIQHAGRLGGDNPRAIRVYQEGMAEAFRSIWRQLSAEGRLVIVFAHKQPDAWESLVAGMISAGFVASASWPIQTEMPNKAAGGARLASSVWLVCKKREAVARPGWDNLVLEEMRSKIYDRLREFWDAGIRGPDFVWAATGPALEAYSKHPVVRKANEPGKVMEVSDFLKAVRRIVVDFVVGRALSLNGGGQRETGLDDVTTYYLLHRNDFKMDDAPIGACILYAVSCNLSDKNLADRYDILVRTGGQVEEVEEDSEIVSDGHNSEVEEGTGSKVKLRPWHQRKRKTMGYDAYGALAPMIDQVHRLMHLWKAGDLVRVNEYVDSRALGRNALFHQLLQALIELAPARTEERSLLESISNHLASRGPVTEKVQMDLPA